MPAARDVSDCVVDLAACIPLKVPLEVRIIPGARQAMACGVRLEAVGKQVFPDGASLARCSHYTNIGSRRSAWIRQDDAHYILGSAG